MVLYHGSRIRGLREILPAAITGATPTDGRAGMLDVVYVTTSIDHARSYAGRNGSVYVVDAPDAVSIAFRLSIGISREMGVSM